MMTAILALNLSIAAADLALVGGEIHTVSGAVIPKGTVVVRGEQIVLVGRDAPVPRGARIIDCGGKIVTPGLIESDSAIGLVEIAAEPSTADQAPRTPDPIRAAYYAGDAIDLRSSLIAVARRHGVVAAVSAPSGGLVAGRSAWVDLVDARAPAAATAVQGPLAMHASLGAAAGQTVGGTRPTAILRLREVLDDARVFAKDRAAFQRNALYTLSASRLDLAALGDVVTGKMRLLVHASRAADIRAALALAAKERLRIGIIGAEEGWLVAGELAQARVPVIVNPLDNLPDQMESRNARSDNATLMAQAGVRVAIATRSSHNAGGLRFVLGNAVRAGLPRELALRAATQVPAEIFGLERSYGTIEVGRRASLVVWSGDPFEPASTAERVIIRGEEVSTESRQSRLARRYLERHGLVPPPR